MGTNRIESHDSSSQSKTLGASSEAPRQAAKNPERNCVLLKKVIILGGGVGGMSAAHELIERGFEVEVYARQNIPGGKARSIPV
ncbi:MAG: NAD(P)-binding protein, partial [Nitrospira sp.]|nr:NAD(P)-binding protein [Nitrospira sp.]